MDNGGIGGLDIKRAVIADDGEILALQRLAFQREASATVIGLFRRCGRPWRSSWPSSRRT